MEASVEEDDDNRELQLNVLERKAMVIAEQNCCSMSKLREQIKAGMMRNYGCDITDDETHLLVVGSFDFVISKIFQKSLCPSNDSKQRKES